MLSSGNLLKQMPGPLDTGEERRGEREERRARGDRERECHVMPGHNWLLNSFHNEMIKRRRGCLRQTVPQLVTIITFKEKV